MLLDCPDWVPLLVNLELIRNIATASLIYTILVESNSADRRWQPRNAPDEGADSLAEQFRGLHNLSAGDYETARNGIRPNRAYAQGFFPKRRRRTSDLAGNSRSFSAYFE